MSHGLRQSLDNHPAPNRKFETALNQGKVTATDLTVEKVGVSARQIDYRFNEVKSHEEATDVAENLVRRVDYLLEPLAIIERDPSGRQIQIRSQKPSSDGDTRRYYEMNVDHSGVSIERYAAAGGDREQDEIHLTRESFERLCHDLDDASVNSTTKR
ncbi:hypothetical protein DTL21_23595 [Bremerella cremea]|uniref:Uncharacterized protein n=1 Tax=Blastopirellula marina TaxID=124 RepID=A0A2S8FDV8_9BACT|nr:MULTISPECIES: hypothetical protein [Pirellulaceae]PQO30346.1 hypothetical protein C5Y83_23560 [Blastopirellula marina]RCS43697.1 hypothetical protein DTL21_23595 [Bremerella cremea]